MSESAADLEVKLNRARHLLAELVRADNNRCGHGPGGRINAGDTLPLQNLLGLSLTIRDMFEGHALAAPTSPSEPAVKIDGQTITVEWLKHCGWQDADIATALADRDHSDCDMTPEGWDCSDGDGNRLHPLHDDVDETAALVMFVLEKVPSASVEPVPSTPRVWAMPEIPEDVKAVRNRHGVRLFRVARSSSGGPIWEDEVGHWVSERELIAELGPLTEVEETNDAD